MSSVIEEKTKEKMSVREAGRRGGKRTSKTRGREFYQEIGRKGGEHTSAADEEFYSDIGRRGGQKVRRLIEKGQDHDNE